MSITGKIITILLSLLVLGLWPLFFGKFIDNRITSRYAVFQITLNGWAFLISALIAIILNIGMIVLDDKANKQQQQNLEEQLSDIQSAIKKSNSRYDSATKTIIRAPININTGDAAFVLQGENVSAHGIQINQNANSSNVIIEQDFLSVLHKVSRDFKIDSKDVYILIIRGTNGAVAKEEIKRLLTKNGYKILGEGEADRPNLKSGVLVETLKDRLCVSIGNMPI